MKISGNTILVTGGGSGIGEALAQRFHDAGNMVIVSGRREEALQKAIAGRGNMRGMTFDVGDKASIADFANRLVGEFPTLNVIVNNAGIMHYEQIDHARALDHAEATISTNLLGPIRLIDALVDHLSAQADAAIITVTSGLAFVPMVGAPTYSATKAAIHSYTQSLREVLKGKIEVIELAPPAVQTDLTPGQSTRAGYQPLEEFADEAFALLQQQPTPAEILVERVRPVRFAEAQGTFDQAFARLSEVSRANAASIAAAKG